MSTETKATVRYLRYLVARRDAGHAGSYTTDPAWLVHQAINRRAGWLEERHYRGTAQPTCRGRFPRRAEGGYLRGLVQLAHKISTPRLIVRIPELGEHRWLAQRLPRRFEQ